MTLTDKQRTSSKRSISVMSEVIYLTDELLEVLPYKTTKQSIQFSIRALIKKGLVEKGHTRQRSDNRYHRRTLGLTTLGQASEVTGDVIGLGAYLKTCICIYK